MDASDGVGQPESACFCITNLNLSLSDLPPVGSGEDLKSLLALYFVSAMMLIFMIENFSIFLLPKTVFANFNTF